MQSGSYQPPGAGEHENDGRTFAEAAGPLFAERPPKLILLAGRDARRARPCWGILPGHEIAHVWTRPVDAYWLEVRPDRALHVWLWSAKDSWTGNRIAAGEAPERDMAMWRAELAVALIDRPKPVAVRAAEAFGDWPPSGGRA